MGKGFGNLTKAYGLVSYSLSPFEQRAWSGAVVKGIPNLMKRFAQQVFKVAPPFIGVYLVYDWAENESINSARKQPKSDSS